MVRILIMVYLPRSYLIERLLGPLEHFDQPPALGLAHGARRHDEHLVANTGLVLLVVRVQLGGALDVLAVLRVLHQTLHRHDDGLVHLVTVDDADERLASGRSRLGLGLNHRVPAPSATWRSSASAE